MATQTMLMPQLSLVLPSSYEQRLVPSSYLEMLPDELLLKILVYVMSEQSPFSLENCIDRARSSQRFKSAIYAQRWHKTHLKDWVLINSTCRRIRHVGWEAFFTSKTVFASQSLGGKLVDDDDQAAGWCRASRPLFHASLLDYVRDLVIAPVNVQSASDFAKMPAFLQSFTNLKTCTLQISYRQGDSIDYVKDRTVLGKKEKARRFGVGRDTTQELKRRLVALGVSKKIDLRLAVCPHLNMTTSWYENILERNVFPVLDVRISLLS